MCEMESPCGLEGFGREREGERDGERGGGACDVCSRTRFVLCEYGGQRNPLRPFCSSTVLRVYPTVLAVSPSNASLRTDVIK